MECPVKRRKGPTPRLCGGEVCSVCGDRASGYHYQVLSCEGCKGFFRRSVINKSVYTCPGSGHCNIDTYMRRKCQHCRLQQCRAAGMREHCVLSEKQIQMKKLMRRPAVGRGGQGVRGGPPGLSPPQADMIKKLVAAQQQSNHRCFTNHLNITPWPVGDVCGGGAREQCFAHFTDLAILSVQEIVDFAKQVPGFLTLSRDDQISLLKASSIEIMLLGSCRRYDPQSQTIAFLRDSNYSQADLAGAGLLLEFINPMFEFSRRMFELQVDDAEYCLLITISLLSADRPHVQDHQLVERLQHQYVAALHSYISTHRPTDRLMFARLLMRLVCLRSLSCAHSHQVLTLRLQDKRLPPLLSEIWDTYE